MTQPRNIDAINTSNVALTGATVAFPQATFDVEVYWTDNSGIKHHFGPQTVIFPNDLSDVPLDIRNALIKQLAWQLVEIKVKYNLGLLSADEIRESLGLL